ncbi:hypothetical protein E3P99_03709 [Wallemia hederae]|uniref:Band 7 domain-containing protein n=1 Tax=Wallemia hederae TaxID=1540922 RepID=A0A4T0FEW8_9BASI|nr:hypothetical protein E3P99_03709 [Wallemia hederae]
MAAEDINDAEVHDTHFDADEPVKPSPAPATAPASSSPPKRHTVSVQPLQKDQMQPSYAQTLEVPRNEHSGYGSFINGLGSCVGFLGAIPCCPCPNPFKEVDQGSVGLVSRFGAFYKSVDPGLVKINLCSEDLQTVSVRTQLANIKDQVAITKDNVTVRVDGVVYYSVHNPYKAAYAVEDMRSSVIERSQITLRSVLGSRTLQSLIQDREQISRDIEEIVTSITQEWGVLVSISIRDVHLSESDQVALAASARATRQAEAKVVAAKGEVSAAKLMKQTAELLATPAAMSIRHLDALQNMAKTSNAKTIFVPMSIDGVQSLSQGMGGGNAVAGGSSTTRDQDDPAARTAQLHALEGM